MKGLVKLSCFKITLLGFLTTVTDADAQTNAIQLSPQQVEQQKRVDEIVNTPFDFYGRVIDEQGMPVSGANIVITVMGEVGKVEGETKHNLISDKEGLFSLKEIRAFGVFVTVSKKGYVPNLNVPNSFGHVGGWSPSEKNFPTEQAPAVYPLQAGS